MEHIQQLLNHLHSLRNQSAHQSGFGIILSPQYLLVFIVYKRLSLNNLVSSPLAKQFVNSVQNSEFIPFSDLIKVGDNLPLDIKHLSDEDFFNLSQGLIQECLKEINRGNEVYTPTKLNEILVELLSPQSNQIIYDPACGIGSTFVEIHKRYPDLNLKFVGQEINRFTYLLCQINLLINGIGNAEIYCTNSLFAPLIEYKSKVDFAVSEPSFNLRVNALEDSTTRFIDTMLSMIRKEGKVIVVVSDSFLYSSRNAVVRNEYLSEDLIEQVISLPETIYRPNSSRKASIIVLNKNRTVKGKIVFSGIDFDNSSKFEKTEVDLNEIIRTDLRANRYALRNIKEVELLFKASTYPVVKIDDVVSHSKLGRVHKTSYVPNRQLTEHLPYVRAVDLPKDDDNPTLDLSKIVRIEPLFSNHSVINFPAVLCSLIGDNLKPTIFNYKGQSIIISSDLIALELNENVNVDYFIIQLKSEYVRAQIESISSGISVNRVRREDFLNVQLILPPLETQIHLAIESLKAKQVELRQDISEEKKERKLTEYDVISIAVHNLNHNLGAMQKDLNALKKFFQDKLPNYLQEPIKDVFEGDTEEEINQMKLINVLQRLINTRNEASAKLAATREELQNNAVAPIKNKNFKKWLEREIKPLYETEIDFIVMGEETKFDFDPNRFKSLIRNLIINAQQHNAHKVVFDLSYIYLGNKKQDKESVRILYKNDGNPFPEDFDFDLHFKGLYQKSDESRGSGIGGYSINKTIELHSGEMNNVSPEKETFDLFPVQIEIILPIEHKPNPIYVKSNPYTTS